MMLSSSLSTKLKLVYLVWVIRAETQAFERAETRVERNHVMLAQNFKTRPFKPFASVNTVHLQPSSSPEGQQQYGDPPPTAKKSAVSLCQIYQARPYS